MTRVRRPQPIVPEHDDARVDPDLLAFTRALMTEYHTPGVGLGVTHRGRTAVAGLGVTNIDNPVPVDGDTLFQIGSVTKTVTGTAMMALIERGEVELDAPVRRYLPDFAVADPDVSEQVTVHHLMTHSCGWEGDVFEETGWGDDALAAVVAKLRDLPQATRFGTMWSYNNAAFYVLGRIIEVVHGQPYDRAMRQLLLEPLGMDDACWFAHDVILRRHAVGHAIGPHGLQVARPWAMPRSTLPAGSLVASARDMMRFARLHLRTRDTPSALLAQTTLDLMHAPGLPDGTAGDETGIRLALTWFIDDRSGRRVLTHGGGANGQPADLYLIPSEEFGLVVLTNCQNNDHLVADRLVRWAQEHYFGMRRPAAEPVAPEQFGDLSDVEGVYEGHQIRFEVRRDGDSLKLGIEAKYDWLEGMDPPWDVVEGVEIVPTGPDTGVIEPLDRNEPIVFLRDASGEVRWMHAWLRASRRVRAGSP